MHSRGASSNAIRHAVLVAILVVGTIAPRTTFGDGPLEILAVLRDDPAGSDRLRAIREAGGRFDRSTPGRPRLDPATGSTGTTNRGRPSTSIAAVIPIGPPTA